LHKAFFNSTYKFSLKDLLDAEQLEFMKASIWGRALHESNKFSDHKIVCQQIHPIYQHIWLPITDTFSSAFGGGKILWLNAHDNLSHMPTWTHHPLGVTCSVDVCVPVSIFIFSPYDHCLYPFSGLRLGRWFAAAASKSSLQY